MNSYKRQCDLYDDEDDKRRRSSRTKKFPRSYSPPLQSSSKVKSQKPKICEPKPKVSLKTVSEFECDHCHSKWAIDPLRKRRDGTKAKNGSQATTRNYTDPVTGQKLHLCNACGLSVKRPPKKPKIVITYEDKQTYIAEAQAFAQALAQSMGDQDAERLYCPRYVNKPCKCVQIYLVCGGRSECMQKRASHLLKLMKTAQLLSQQKCHNMDDTDQPTSSKKRAGMGNGHKKSPAFEKFIMTERHNLRDDLGLCERAAQQILCYSNNFIFKRIKTEQRQRAEYVKGKTHTGKIIPIEDIHQQKCCHDNCVLMALTHQKLLHDWRTRAQSCQKEARRVVAEMLTPAGLKANCYTFITMVTGCGVGLLSSVNTHMRSTGGSREPPPHGLVKYWKKRPRKGESEAASATITSLEEKDDEGQVGLVHMAAVQTLAEPSGVLPPGELGLLAAEEAADTSMLTDDLDQHTTRWVEVADGTTIYQLPLLHNISHESFLQEVTVMPLTEPFTLPVLPDQSHSSLSVASLLAPPPDTLNNDDEIPIAENDHHGHSDPENDLLVYREAERFVEMMGREAAEGLEMGDGVSGLVLSVDNHEDLELCVDTGDVGRHGVRDEVDITDHDVFLRANPIPVHVDPENDSQFGIKEDDIITVTLDSVSNSESANGNIPSVNLTSESRGIATGSIDSVAAVVTESFVSVSSPVISSTHPVCHSNHFDTLLQATESSPPDISDDIVDFNTTTSPVISTEPGKDPMLSGSVATQDITIKLPKAGSTAGGSASSGVTTVMVTVPLSLLTSSLTTLTAQGGVVKELHIPLELAAGFSSNPGLLGPVLGQIAQSSSNINTSNNSNSCSSLNHFPGSAPFIYSTIQQSDISAIQGSDPSAACSSMLSSDIASSPCAISAMIQGQSSSTIVAARNDGAGIMSSSTIHPRSANCVTREPDNIPLISSPISNITSHSNTNSAVISNGNFWQVQHSSSPLSLTTHIPETQVSTSSYSTITKAASIPNVIATSSATGRQPPISDYKPWPQCATSKTISCSSAVSRGPISLPAQLGSNACVTSSGVPPLVSNIPTAALNQVQLELQKRKIIELQRELQVETQKLQQQQGQHLTQQHLAQQQQQKRLHEQQKGLQQAKQLQHLLPRQICPLQVKAHPKEQHSFLQSAAVNQMQTPQLVQKTQPLPVRFAPHVKRTHQQVETNPQLKIRSRPSLQQPPQQGTPLQMKKPKVTRHQISSTPIPIAAAVSCSLQQPVFQPIGQNMTLPARSLLLTPPDANMKMSTVTANYQRSLFMAATMTQPPLKTSKVNQVDNITPFLSLARIPPQADLQQMLNPAAASASVVGPTCISLPSRGPGLEIAGSQHGSMLEVVSSGSLGRKPSVASAGKPVMTSLLLNNQMSVPQHQMVSTRGIASLSSSLKSPTDTSTTPTMTFYPMIAMDKNSQQNVILNRQLSKHMMATTGSMAATSVTASAASRNREETLRQMLPSFSQVAGTQPDESCEQK